MITCLFFLFLLLPTLTYSNSQPCLSSSCGKITNISHPFRLKQDPEHCGNKRYELDCVNNVTVLSLYDGYYLVESINYKNYTIRVVDPNIQPTNCSSLPGFFLSRNNFTNFDSMNWRIPKENNSYAYDLTRWGYKSIDYPDPHPGYYIYDLSRPVIFMKCTSPPSKVVDEYYVDGTSGLDQHTYVIVGDPRFEILEPQCRVKFVTFTSFWGGSIRSTDSVIANVSYIDVHKGLRYGFEIFNCPCDECFLNDTINEIECFHDPTGKASSYINKYDQLIKGWDSMTSTNTSAHL
ncbi:unnamed protein product [Lathyrus sativus]|nr:unnamed protein product [Lathyrus sativus]